MLVKKALHVMHVAHHFDHSKLCYARHNMPDIVFRLFEMGNY